MSCGVFPVSCSKGIRPPMRQSLGDEKTLPLQTISSRGSWILRILNNAAEDCSNRFR